MSQVSYLEDGFLRGLGVKVEDLEPLAANCTQVGGREMSGWGFVWDGIGDGAGCVWVVGGAESVVCDGTESVVGGGAETVVGGGSE